MTVHLKQKYVEFIFDGIKNEVIGYLNKTILKQITRREKKKLFTQINRKQS